MKVIDVVCGPVCIDCMKTFDQESNQGMTVFSCACERDLIVYDRDMVVLEVLLDGYAQSLYVNKVFHWMGSVRATVDAVEEVTKLGIFIEMDRIDFVKRMREMKENGTVHSV